MNIWQPWMQQMSHSSQSQLQPHQVHLDCRLCAIHPLSIHASQSPRSIIIITLPPRYQGCQMDKKTNINFPSFISLVVHRGWQLG
jgi:hypothetical protein